MTPTNPDNRASEREAEIADPGPWRVLDYTSGEKIKKGFIAVVGPGGQHIADVFPFGMRHGGKSKEIERHRANAHLIAAAPEMFEALKIIAECSFEKAAQEVAIAALKARSRK